MSDAKTYLNRLLGVSSGSPVGTALPDVPKTDNRSLYAFMSAVKDWINRASSTGESRLLTWLDVMGAGLVTVDANGAIVPVAQPGGVVLDYTPPPTPTGLAAAGAMTNILVTWNAPAYANHAYTEVWAHSADVLGSAVLVGTVYGVGAMFSHAVGTGQSRYYWVRFVSTADVEGAWNSSTGTAGATSNDPAWLLSVLTGQINNAQLANSMIVERDAFAVVAANRTPGQLNSVPFAVLTTTMTINGVAFTPGVYIDGASINTGSIGNAQIGVAAIDDAKIANVSAAKLTAGGIAVGQYIQSSNYAGGTAGWRIHGDGSLEMNTGTFRGALSAATGTFAGALSAATGTFAGALSAATGTFAGSLSAATGSFSGQVTVGAGSSVDYSYVSGTKPPADANNTANSLNAGTTITGGGITLSGGGSIRGGKASWGDVNEGFFLGYTGTVGQYGLDITGTGMFKVRSATTGARVEQTEKTIKVYDASGVLRVHLGDLSA